MCSSLFLSGTTGWLCFIIVPLCISNDTNAITKWSILIGHFVLKLCWDSLTRQDYTKVDLQSCSTNNQIHYYHVCWRVKSERLIQFPSQLTIPYYLNFEFHAVEIWNLKSSLLLWNSIKNSHKFSMDVDDEWLTRNLLVTEVVTNIDRHQPLVTHITVSQIFKDLQFLG